MTGQTHGSPPIVLTTDFGLSDAFVGVMKGVILNINPRAVIVDLTHDIGPQDVSQGAFVLGVNHPYFPPGAIHVAVVDPGVGTDRHPIVLETPDAKFVAPDNGLLSEVLKGYLAGSSFSERTSETVSLPPALLAYRLANPSYRLDPVSNTFHGRDIFAPAAAHLSLGVKAAKMGPPVSQLAYRPLAEPSRREGIVVGEVIYVDRFGNLITNIEMGSISGFDMAPDSATVEINGRKILGLSRTFHDMAGDSSPQPDGLPLVALFGSNGYLEIAVRDGNAAETLGLDVGTEVRVGHV